MRDRPAVAVCRSGRRSRQAVRLPASPGIDAVDVADVADGMNAWAKAGRRPGLPVVDERGPGGRIT